MKEESLVNPNKSEHSIEIGCPPGNPRPGDLFPEVLEGSGLNEEDFDFKGILFGDAEWVLKPGKEDLFLKSKDTFKKRLSTLYKRGVIRYASW